LDRRGEAGYLTDGVDPEGDTTGHVYTYRVKYTDADNEAPMTGYPKVMIDKNLDGDYLDADEVVTLTEVNAADTTYTDGKLYTYSTRLSYIGDYTYYFSARDTNGRPATGDPTIEQMNPRITSINEPPILNWLEMQNYEDDGLDPETGTTSTQFIYRIEYMDVLDEAPAAGFPKILLDMDGDGDFYGPTDESYTMDEETPDDISYDNGKIYKYNRTLGPSPQVGDYHYMFYAEDLTHLNATTESRVGPDVASVGDPPVLSPTGETNYETDGVDPDNGSDTTEFVFRVKFSDADGHVPATGYPKVGIDLDVEGNITPAERFEMVEVDPADTDTTDGKLYTYGMVLGGTPPITYNYMFETMDNTSTWATPLVYSGPTVDSTNAPPILKWIGLVGYDTDGLEPESGNANQTVFIYKVLYEDTDDDAPLVGSPQVWLDMDMDGSQIEAEWFEMEDPDANATDYVNGKIFEYHTTFASAGEYNYSFKAKDVKGSLAGGSPIGIESGPIVFPPPNLPPRLEFLGIGDFSDTGVFPTTGDLDTDFTYKVNYVDAEGDLPGTNWPMISIDVEGDGDYAGANDIETVMTEEDTNDTTVQDGKVYVFTTKLPVEGTSYTYRFKAKDVNDKDATGTGTVNNQVFDGPDVIINKNPLLTFAGTPGFENDGVEPNEADEGSTFTFRVIYTDPEGDGPFDGVDLIIDMNLDGKIDAADTPKVMAEVDADDTNFTDGKEYSLEVVLDTPGTYGNRFDAMDINSNPASGPAGADYIAGPVVNEIIPNRPPTLVFTGEANFKNDGVNPLTAMEPADFTFRVMYIDLDNDAPAAEYPKLKIGDDTYVMVAVDTGDTNYVDGKIYTFQVGLDKGDYSYSFEVLNTINQTASLGPLEGPIVTKEEKTDADQEQILSDMFWLLILIILAIVAMIIGYAAGSRRKKEEPPPRSHEPRSMPIEDDGGAVTEPLPAEPIPEDTPADEGPELETPVEGAPEAGEPEVPVVEGGAGADLAAGAEQPAEAVEEAQAPEEQPPEPAPVEERADLKAKQDETEAPAEDTESIAEEQPEKVDDEIDSILSKLEE